MRRLLAALALAASLFEPCLAAETLHVDAAYVAKSGAGKRAVIFLPDLASGAAVWDAVVPQVAKKYAVYAITFAGFDGEPPAEPPYLEAFTKSVQELIAQEKLDKPILVGHGFGGFVALKLAETIPEQIGGVLLLDIVPIFPVPAPGETPQSRVASISALRDQFLSSPQAQYEGYVRTFAGQLVSDPKNVELVASAALRSDRATYAGAFYELATSDLRPGLPKIAAPVELLMPAASETYEPQIAAYYSQLYIGTKNYSLVPIVPSKHFIMYDAPEKFASALDAFLEKYAP